MIFIGVDPGINGAVAIVDHDGALLSVMRTPTISNATARGRPEYDVRAMHKMLAHAVTIPDDGNLRFVLELVHSFPGEGTVSCFKFGVGWGLWMGLASGMQLPIIELTPQDWQRVALRGHPMKNPKATSYLVATRLWPNLDPALARPPYGGADAALMADAARRMTFAREKRIAASQDEVLNHEADIRARQAGM